MRLLIQQPPSAAFGSLSLGLFVRRITGSVVGRPAELAAVEREMDAAQTAMACLAVEGEPGIGKSRLLLAIAELARSKGFTPIAVTADEEIRGPFLVARSIFGSPAVAEAASGAPALEALQRVSDALTNANEQGLEGLTPDRKLVRVFDQGAVAIRGLAAVRPLAILVDDMQWADEDSLRLLRYVVRTCAASPVLLVLASRSDEAAFVNEAVTLLADMDRMGILHRLKLSRFSQAESAEFLRQVLAAPISPSSAAVMHAQAEGVPFILAEQVHAYRDAGMIQQIDGVWTLARNAERLLPSAVRTLIQRRAARLPDATKSALADAAVLGRSFSLRDLRDIKSRLDQTAVEAQVLAEALAPAVATGLLIRHPAGSAADYTFPHDQVREYAASTLSAVRRRNIHEAIVQMLTAGGEPPVGSLALLAQHALAAGRAEAGARFSVDAARAALQAHAPEEVLRLVDQARLVADSVQDRVALLCLQDDALDMLRRPAQRLEGLAQLAALAEALGDAHLEMDVTLRRAAAFRLSKEYERAAELARRVRGLAAERNDRQAELAACLELGQNLLRSEIGESFSAMGSELDLAGAAEVFARAVALAKEVGDDAHLAAATRELGVVALGHVRTWFAGEIMAGRATAIQQRVLDGETLGDMLPGLPIAGKVMEAGNAFRAALEIYERLGDRQGAMATIIGMAYISWAPNIHVAGAVNRIEDLRRLATRMKSITKESERALADAQMLYGSHVYSRAKVFPAVALVKGQEAYNAARSLGDSSLEFASAGGMALVHAELGAVDRAEEWLTRAATVASAGPTPLRGRLLESRRGIVRSAAGDAAGMREHLERAVQLATGQGFPAARCEALARLAVEAARLGAEGKDEQLLALAERSANEAKALMRVLPGRPPWGEQAEAALARVALTRGALPAAAAAGRAALAGFAASMREDMCLDVQLPAAEALIAAGSEEEKIAARGRLQFLLKLLVSRLLDEDVRTRWLRGPSGRELTRLAGPMTPGKPATTHVRGANALGDGEVAVLRLLAEGMTNREIAQELQLTEESVTRQLAELFVKMGATSRADAMSTAIMGNLV